MVEEVPEEEHEALAMLVSLEVSLPAMLVAMLVSLEVCDLAFTSTCGWFDEGPVASMSKPLYLRACLSLCSTSALAAPPEPVQHKCTSCTT